MSTVLYRKYRPQQFSDIVGQQHVVETLQRALANDQVAHAYLFTGPRGSGKTTTARLLAKALNCTNRQGSEPCSECAACTEVGENRAIDLIEIDAASHTGVDDIRQLKEGVDFAPTSLNYKVYIIDEAHQLSKSAANALLKTLEEPPAHAVFVLATTEVHKMISTIISRCQRFDFSTFTLEEITDRLATIAEQEKTRITQDALEQIAIRAGGTMRDAESILDQVLAHARGEEEEVTGEGVKQLLGAVTARQVHEFIGYILENDTKNALHFIDGLIREGNDIEAFLQAAVGYMRQALVATIDPGHFNPLTSGLTKEEYQQLQQQIEGVGETRIRTILESLLGVENKLRYASLPQLPLEIAAVELTTGQ